jgi:XTP/dITP diphosphohydrolase
VNKVYFVTGNQHKAREAQALLQPFEITLRIVDHPVQEILHLDPETVARDKLLKAYRYLGHPCAIEHGALEIDALGQLPGGLTKPIWERLREGVCELVPASASRRVVARSVVGYCDGRKLHFFHGETIGRLAARAAGDGGFSWDPIFVPEGAEHTFAEMDAATKSKFSHGQAAWRQFADWLTTSRTG